MFLNIIILICLSNQIRLIISQPEQSFIKRADYFRPLDYSDVKLSYDGKWLAYVGVYKGVPNLFVKTLPNGTAKQLTFDLGRGVAKFDLARDNKTLLYQQDFNGDENYKLYTINVETGENKTVSTPPGAQSTILYSDKNRPFEIVVGLNQRDPRYHDAYILDVKTAQLKLIMENRFYTKIYFNDKLQAKIGQNLTESASLKFFYFHDNGSVELIKHAPPFDQIGTVPIYIDPEGWIYWIDYENVDKAGLSRLNPKNKRNEIVYVAKRADIVHVGTELNGRSVTFHPITHKPLWLYEYYDKPELVILDQSFAPDFETIKRVQTPGSYPVVQMSDDANRWLVELVSDNKPPTHYLYERKDKSLQRLFSAKSDWSNHTFSKTYAKDVVTSDGFVEMCYLNLPPRLDNGQGQPAKPMATVLLVHGGPQGRDGWDFDLMTQFLAVRYAVLRCNFRASTPGYGKIFANAGNGEWGRRMQQDLTDAVQWAISMKISDPKRVAIVGGSYGGYATLAGVTFTPDLYACGVAVAAPANLITTARMIPEYWKPILPSLNLQMSNDPKDNGGEAFLRSRSPLFFANRIKVPLMIVHGDLDPRVDKLEAEQMIDALKTNTTVPITFVRYPDEGHGINNPKNMLSVFAISDQFLAKCLGGTAEPITDEIINSSANVTFFNN